MTAGARYASYAAERVPYSVFLHQRHYGGAFRQLLDATSEQRGNLIEDAVEALFTVNGVPFVRTGAHNQAEIAARFEVTVQPAPDFVVYDETDTLRAMLECKGANDGGTARDKALRFARLHAESVRLGGIPLVAVLSGLGWTRVNDTLGARHPGLRRAGVLRGQPPRVADRVPLSDATCPRLIVCRVAKEYGGQPAEATSVASPGPSRIASAAPCTYARRKPMSMVRKRLIQPTLRFRLHSPKIPGRESGKVPSAWAASAW